MSQFPGFDALMPYKKKILAELEATLRVNALDNRGLLTSPRQAPKIAAQIGALWFNFLTGTTEPQEVENLAASLVEQGFTYSSASKAFSQLQLTTLDIFNQENISDSKTLSRINQISDLFLSKVATQREILVLQERETYQASLQQALQLKLESERALANQLEQRQQRLQKVVDIDLIISPLTDEAELLQQFVTLAQAMLHLDGVTVFELGANRQTIIKRASAGAVPQAPSPTETISPDSLITQAISQTQPMATRQGSEDSLRDEILIPLGTSSHPLGVLVLWIPTTAELEPDFELVRGLAIVLGSAWQNVRLLAQIQERAHDLEILHGQRIQQTWSTVKSSLQQTFVYDGIRVQTQSALPPPEGDFVIIPMRLRDVPIGQLRLPVSNDQSWAEEDIAFAEAMLREMLIALENSSLVQVVQRRAGRERTIREITERMRAATSLQELVKVTTRELGQHLSAGHAVVELGIETETDNSELAASIPNNSY